MKNYIPKSTKSKSIQKIINEALEILESVGIPMDSTERRLERMAMCFLAVSGVNSNWANAKKDTILGSREIINFINTNFKEKISSGGYDDIRRKDLILLELANLIIKVKKNTNDPTTKNALHPDFRNLIVFYKTDKWNKSLKAFNKNKPVLSEILARKRNIEKLPVRLPNGGKLIELSLGEHNVLQKAIVDEFLPRFGSDCTVLYIGDSSHKSLHIETEKLRKLNFFELSHDELPDIVAYSEKNDWLYLIEAVHSSGPMSEPRVLKLKKMLNDCNAQLIFVTAFLTRSQFKKWMDEIAWETEVWTADKPEHLVHFNGHKFLGPY